MKFKFYADENVPSDLTVELQRLGCNVLTAYEAGHANQGIPDTEVLAIATMLGRSVLTCNRSDFIDLHRRGIEHGGVIVCKEDKDIVAVGQFLYQYLLTQDDLTNRLLRVFRQNQRGLSEPVLIIREY